MRHHLLPLVVLYALISTSAQAQNGFNREPDYFPLGGIEAQGVVELVGGDWSIVVKEIYTKGLAEKSGLRLGDQIITADGMKLSGKTEGQVIDGFCTMIEMAEATKPTGKFGKIALQVKRSGQVINIAQKVRYYGAPSKNEPLKCKKTAKIILGGLKFLAGNQESPGNQKLVANNNQAVATAAPCGLAWIGSGKRKYAKNISKAVDFVMDSAGKSGAFQSASSGGPNWNQTNWALSYATIFLSEYLAQKKKGAVKKRLREIVEKLQGNQEPSGGWAHGPGGPNALKYLELEIMSNLALGGMGMAQRVGIKLDNAVVVRGYQYVKKCTFEGGVAYSPLPGQFGVGDPGRTAGAFWALRQVAKGKDLQGEMAKFYENGIETLYEGHACPTMHVLNGALASALLGKTAYTTYWNRWRRFIMASRTTKGAFGCRPNHESLETKKHPDRSWGPSFVTAHYIVSLQVGQGRYKILDKIDDK